MTATDTLLRVLEICLPIFVMVGFGAWLRSRGIFTEGAQLFVNRFVYLFSLPLLIFLGIAAQDFRSLIHPAVIGATIGATLAGFAIFALIARLLPMPDAVRAPISFSVFWGNVTYLGFPLAFNAFGERGLVYAGIVNAFTMPVFIVLGILLLSRCAPERQDLHPGRQVLAAVRNPLVLAALAGVLASLLLHETGLHAWATTRPGLMRGMALLLRCVDMVEVIGLPLALLAVGAALRLERVRGNIGLMLLGCAGKLVISPLLTLGLLHAGVQLGWFAPPEPAALGAAVLLMATPLAVAAFVISERLGAAADFTAGLMVLSVCCSCITIPIWVALLI